MLDQSSDVPESELGESGIAIASKQRLSFFPERLVGVHAAAIVAVDRLRHEGNRLPVLVGNIFHDVLE